MFKKLLEKLKGFVSPVKEVPPTPASEQEIMSIHDDPVRSSVKPVPEPVPIPKTIADIVKQEAPPESKPKKPRRPRVKKVAPSSDVIALYKEPEVQSTDKPKRRKPRTPK